MKPAVQNTRSFARFAWGVLFYNVAVILWGAYVRATGSGAGCGSHWPLCNGDIVPRGARLETLIEYTHRVTSGLDLAGVAVLVWWATRLFPRGHRARTAARLSAVFLVLEALLGAGLVLFDYVARNASLWRAAYLSAHLTNTLVLLAVLAMTAWFASRPFSEGAQGKVSGKHWATLGIALVVTITGAIAALSDTVFPASSLAAGMRQEFSPAAHILLRLRVAHPAVAVAGAFLLIFLLSGMARGARPELRRHMLLVAGAVFLQLLAGVVNLALLAPVWMQIVHLALATGLWLLLVIFFLKVREGVTRDAPVAS